MTTSVDSRPVWLEAVPAAVVAVVAAFAMSSAVDELEGRFIVLALVGVAAVAGATWWLSTRSVAVASPLAPPTASVPTTVAPTIAVAAPTLVMPSAVGGFEVLSIPKEGSSPDENEDSVGVDAARGTIAVSDGASSSFAARVWSQALVETALTLRSTFDARAASAVVERAGTAWRKHHEGAEMPWWATEGLRRGAFATLLFVSIGETDGRRGWSASAVGDSCVFHLRPTPEGWTRVTSFPVQRAEEFGSHPSLLSSNSPSIDGLVHAAGALEPGDVLIAATDAVSEWVLSDESRVEFVATAEIAAIEAAARAARTDRSMVNDDVTFVRFRELR